MGRILENMEAKLDVTEFRQLLEDKINPMQDAIARLEESSIKMVELLIAQARQDEILRNIQKDVANNVIVHDDIFKRLRIVESNKTDCKVIENRVSDLEADNSSTDKKVWDVVGWILSALTGGAIATWIFKK